MSLTFKEIKTKLIKKFEEMQNLGIEEDVTLIDGFINLGVYSDLYKGLDKAVPFVPMIGLVGESGRIYLFALKALLPDLDSN